MSKIIEDISDILKSSMGLDYNSIGISSVENAARKRLQATDCQSYEDYLAVIRHSETELKALIESIVIPETWFFRDSKPFHILAEHLNTLKNNKSTSDKINILSLPSSTGEEPYSIAMTLLNHGWSRTEFNIDAYDISDAALEKARNGVYTNNSFRVKNDGYIHSYFTKMNDLYHIDKSVKKCVNFQQGNMFDATDFPFIGKYDVVFCRNLIIYFDTATQTNAFSVLSRLLKNDGLLILGHAETANASNGKFSLAENANAYAYKKHVAKASEKKPPRKKPAFKRTPLPIRKPVSANPSGKSSTTKNVDEKLELEKNIEKELFEHIKNLADTGEISSAIELCTEYLKSDEKDPDANYLLGALYDANGEILNAENYFRKAIYLDPEHINAIIHMAVIAERNGDLKTAERMRLRAKRVEERKSVKMDKMA